MLVSIGSIFVFDAFSLTRFYLRIADWALWVSLRDREFILERTAH